MKTYNEVVGIVASRFSDEELRLPMKKDIADEAILMAQELFGDSSFNIDEFLWSISH